METKGTCKTLGYVILILGIIGSFITAKTLGITYDYYYEARDWSKTIAYFVSGVLTTSCLSFILLALSEILEKLEEVDYHIKDMSETADKYGINTEIERSEYMIKNGGWKCSHCGTVNDSYVGTCVCGHTKQ